MGKGGAQGKSRGSSSASASDDDSLLAAAIAENQAIQAKERQDAHQQQQQQPAAPSCGVLSGDAVVEKLNQCPCFCLLNGEKNMVGLKDPTDPTGQLEVCVWFTDAAEAKQTLAACQAANPDLRESLHLGVTPLGLAFAFSSGWADCHFFGDKQIRGSMEPFAGQQDPTALLAGQVASQGLEARSWHVPVFSCDALQSPTVMPLFLSRKALAEAWVTSGRKLADIPSELAVMDLGLVVHQMMHSETFAWSTVHFVTERKAVQLVTEARASAGAARTAAPNPSNGSAGGGSTAEGSSSEPPPPLLADEAPPPLR